MIDQTLTETASATEAPEIFDELSLLKQRARMLGVDFSNNIGLETLRERVRAKIDGDSDSNSTKAASPELVDPEQADKPKRTLREQLIADSMKLVRVRITNLDPKKKELPGEIFTIANEFIGTVSKYIPYGEVTQDGYHVPHCIYLNLLERKFLNIRTYKDKNDGGRVRVEQTWAQEFAMEVLPQLTPDELKKLAVAQLSAGNS